MAPNVEFHNPIISLVTHIALSWRVGNRGDLFAVRLQVPAYATTAPIALAWANLSGITKKTGR